MLLYLAQEVRAVCAGILQAALNANSETQKYQSAKKTVQMKRSSLAHFLRHFQTATIF